MNKKHFRIMIIVLAVIIVITVGIKLVTTKLENGLKALTNINIQNVDLSQISDGVYQGQHSVFPVSVAVEVSIKDHSISKIDLIKHDNGQGKPAEVIIDQVIERQSLEVDVITGATYSSKVILKAIENALQDKSQ